MVGRWWEDGRVKSSAATLIALVVVAAVGWGFRHEPWPPMRIAGAVVGVAGMTLLCVARYQLGRSFSVRAKALKLVTTGVYARLRNPIYVAGEVVFVGAAMFLMSWLPLVVVAVTVPVQVVRARREASVLRVKFGEEYEVWRHGTWF